MPLDLDHLYPRLEQMAAAWPAIDSAQQRADALACLRATDPDAVRDKISRRAGGVKIPWLVARPVNSLADTFAALPLPADWSVVASDGSAIPPDRHSSVRYYVLNIGYAAITYGHHSDAHLYTDGRFCFRDEELYFDPEGKRIPLEGAQLGILMGVQEMMGLQEAALRLSPPVVAIRDGSLILWSLQNEDVAFKDEYLGRFIAALDSLREQGVPLCSYISYTGGQDVLNSLRLMLCDAPSGGCARCPQQSDDQKLCRTLGALRDRHLFAGLLAPGQRSDLFESQSVILEEYKVHHIQFFYLNVGGEIARIEAPQWVAQNPEMLNLVHAALIDQCRRCGQYPPYPTALIEAHEQAVISTHERAAVELLVERALAARGIMYVRSAKDRSKRGRAV